MLVRTLLFGALTSSYATDQSCDAEDEESLLQTKVQGHTLISQKEVNPSMLLESVKGMAKQLTHDAQAAAIPASMTAAISSVDAALGLMEPALEAEHAHDQQQIQSQVDEIHACHSSEAHGTLVTDTLAGELAIMNQCIADQAAAAATQESECHEWTNHATRLVFPPTALQIDGPETAYEIALSLKDWVDDHWSLIESQRSECNEASATAANEASRCSPVIADYDDKFCEHSQACSLQNACHAHEVEVYTALTQESRIAMNSRVAQYRTIQHVKCVLGLITTALDTNMTIDDSSLASCDGDDVTGDVTHLAMAFPSPQAATDCPAPQSDDPPCSEVDIPLAWAGGEAATSDRLVLHEVPGVATSYMTTRPSNAAYDVFPAYTSWTADFYMTQYTGSSRWGYIAEHYICCGWQGWDINTEPNTNNIQVNIGNGGPATRLIFATNVALGTEFRVTIVYDADTSTLSGYIDGSLGVQLNGEPATKTAGPANDFLCVSQECGYHITRTPEQMARMIQWQYLVDEDDPREGWPFTVAANSYEGGSEYRSSQGEIRDFKFIMGAHH